MFGLKAFEGRHIRNRIILWLEDGTLYLRLRTMSHTIYAAKFELNMYSYDGKVSHNYFNDGNVSRIDGASDNNIVFACFNCTSHIINFRYVDYFQCI